MLALSVLMLSGTPLRAQSLRTMRILPSGATIAQPGATLAVDLTIDNPSNILGYNLALIYPEAILSVTANGVQPSQATVNAGCLFVANAKNDGKICINLSCL